MSLTTTNDSKSFNLRLSGDAEDASEPSSSSRPRRRTTMHSAAKGGTSSTNKPPIRRSTAPTDGHESPALDTPIKSLLPSFDSCQSSADEGDGDAARPNGNSRRPCSDEVVFLAAKSTKGRKRSNIASVGRTSSCTTSAGRIMSSHNRDVIRTAVSQPNGSPSPALCENDQANANSGPLTGVVAVVDVVSNTIGNQSTSVGLELSRLGAVVTRRFTNRVTHLVFEDGKAAHLHKAKHKGVIVVNMFWVERCRKERRWVDEEAFKVAFKDSDDDDVFPIMLFGSRKRPTRTSRKVQLDVEPLAKVEARVRRRLLQQNRRQKMQAAVVARRIASSPGALEAYPFSASETSGRNISTASADDDSSVFFTAEENERLASEMERIKQKMAQLDANCDDSVETTEDLYYSTPLVERMRLRFLTRNAELPDFLSEGPKHRKRVSCFPAVDDAKTDRNGVGRRKNNLSAPLPVIQRDADCIPEYAGACKETSKVAVGSKMAIGGRDRRRLTTICPLPTKRQQPEPDVPVTSAKGGLQAQGATAAEPVTGTAEGAAAAGAKGVLKKKRKQQLSLDRRGKLDDDSGDDADADTPRRRAAGKTAANRKNTAAPLIHKVVRSKLTRSEVIRLFREGHSDNDEKQDAKLDTDLLQANKQRISVFRTKSKVLNQLQQGGVPSSEEFLPKQKRVTLQQRKSADRTEGIVLTNLDKGDREAVASIVRQLGRFYCCTEVDAGVRHVVVGDESAARRTRAVLSAIVNGCWLVSTEWIYRSLEAGKWLDEQKFELSEAYPMAKIRRAEREKGLTYGLLRSCGPIHASISCHMKPTDLYSLVLLCGGSMAPVIGSASIVIGRTVRYRRSLCQKGTKTVSELWLVDSICEGRVKDLDEYML